MAPTVVVALGATAVRAALGAGYRVTRDRGRRLELRLPSGGDVSAVVSTHPSAILRAGDARRGAYRSLVDDLGVAATLR